MASLLLSLSKNFQYSPVSGIIKETGVLLWNNGGKRKTYCKRKTYWRLVVGSSV